MNNNFINKDILEACDEIAEQIKAESKEQLPISHGITFKDNETIEITFILGNNDDKFNSITFVIIKSENIKRYDLSIENYGNISLSSKLFSMLYEFACYINKRLEDYKE